MTAPTPSPEKRALIDAYDTIMRADAERREADAGSVVVRRRRTGIIVWSVFALTVAAGVAIVALRPDWLTLHRALPASPAVQQANLRFAIGLQIERIARYERTHSALPDALPDAGPVVPGMTYRRSGARGYRLTGTDGVLTLTYDSSMPVSAFVGNAYNVLLTRSHQ